MKLGQLQSCISPGSLNTAPALNGWGKRRNVSSVGWKVTLCDPIWHVSSRSGEDGCITAVRIDLTFSALIKIHFPGKSLLAGFPLGFFIAYVKFKGQVHRSKFKAHVQTLLLRKMLQI